MGGSFGDDKIKRAFIEKTMPLFDVWVAACDLDEVEAEILRLKCFDENCPTEEEILVILQEKFNYYYSDRMLRRHWRKIQRKIQSVLP